MESDQTAGRASGKAKSPERNPELLNQPLVGNNHIRGVVIDERSLFGDDRRGAELIVQADAQDVVPGATRDGVCRGRKYGRGPKSRIEVRQEGCSI
jgi:hypothetical protein